MFETTTPSLVVDIFSDVLNVEKALQKNYKNENKKI